VVALVVGSAVAVGLVVGLAPVGGLAQDNRQIRAPALIAKPRITALPCFSLETPPFRILGSGWLFSTYLLTFLSPPLPE